VGGALVDALSWRWVFLVNVPIGLGFAASALLLALFAVVETRIADPLLDLSLFRKPAFTGATIVAFALSASIFSMFLYITLFFQNVLGFSPFEAGLRSLPVTGRSCSSRR
jgi:predicted MFS family arabinose efflux permease